MSSAYYGVFHLVCADAAGIFAGGKMYREKPEGAVIYRSVDHKALREACNAIQSGNPEKAIRAMLPTGSFTPEMKRFAANTSELQGARHLADYDPSKFYPVETVRALLSTAREAMAIYGGLLEFERRAFLNYVLFKKR